VFAGAIKCDNEDLLYPLRVEVIESIPGGRRCDSECSREPTT
jgi:hypothetical protein